MPQMSLTPWQFAAIYSGYQHVALFGGVGVGKSHCGAQFTILNIKEHPEKTGFIGANSHNQLTQATLRELFYWLNEYKMDYVIDRRPPPEWNCKTAFRDYNNILSVRQGKKVTHVFIRILSSPDDLRGIEFSWYWIDETRDTKEYAHDMILGRMRESDYQRGLITTTTNGEDWTYNKFVKNAKRGLFGSLHVPTIKAVEYGILTENYYNTMLASYSPLMAEQELHALHVNVSGGRAYYTGQTRNKLRAAPWGETYPSRQRPLIIGCDFNYQPAPCAWMVGQCGPEYADPKDGILFSDKIHWFGEISGTQRSSIDMTIKLITQFPGFFYKIFGDASGRRGTTSNDGNDDYYQIGNTLIEHGLNYTIDVDQANPRVKSRVENMCSMFLNALGEVRMTYNPDTCPLFDGDIKIVGWKQSGDLDNMGDLLRTHASDGAGYAVYKLFPPGLRATIIKGNTSAFAATR